MIHLKKYFILLALTSSAIAAQDLNFVCIVTDKGSPPDERYGLTLSKDRLSGYFTFRKQQVTQLNLIFKDENVYRYRANNIATTIEIMLPFNEVLINRHDFRLVHSIYDRDLVSQCEISNVKIIDRVKEIRDLHNKRIKKEADDKMQDKMQKEKKAKI